MLGEKLLTVAEVATLLRIRRETVRRYIQDDRLRAFTLPGGDYRVREQDLSSLLQPGRGGCRNNGSV